MSKVFLQVINPNRIMDEKLHVTDLLKSELYFKCKIARGGN